MSEWLVIIGGIGVCNALFLGLIMAVGGQRRNLLLGLVFVAVALRTGKSVAIVLFQHIPDSVVGIGLAGMAMAGPLLYLYFRSLGARDFRIVRRDYSHFALSGLTAILLLLNSDKVVFWLYVGSAVQLAVYLVLSFLLFRREQDALTVDPRKWSALLLGVMGAHWAIYTSQLFIESSTAYLVVSLISAMLMYALMFGLLKWQKVFSVARPVTIDADRAEAIRNRIVQLMEGDMLFKEQNLNVTLLAQRLAVKPYVVSNVLKSSFDKTFPEFVNEYRIREAERLLKSPQHNIYSIEAIAFDCGFNTPSAFYTTFKRYASVTPGEFRQRHHGKTS